MKNSVRSFALCLFILTFAASVASAQNSTAAVQSPQKSTDAPEVQIFCKGDSVLPDMDGWMNGEARTTVLDTISGNKGKWCERDYRTAQGVAVHAVWLDGAGPKGWDVSSRDISANDGELGSGAAYKTIITAGVRSILERHPATGCSLTAKVGDGVLTLESRLASDDEITSVAAELIKKITSAK